MSQKGLSIELDIHTHTLASGHAYGTLREMVAAAKSAGLKLLGTSEHAPGIPGTCHPLYFINAGVVPKTISGVRILFGSEVNILNGGELSLDERIMEGLDYCLAGIHDLCYTVGDREENTEATIRAIRHPSIDAIVHPDSGAIPLDYQRLVTAAAEAGTLLEVNNNALRNRDKRPGCVENYKSMLGYCRALGVSVLLSSDAHDPSDVGNVGEARALLAEVEFPEELVINTSAQRFLHFLEAKHGRPL